jgi:hypothetical protein
MNLNPHRNWITPLVIGAFALSAVTGVLMFFHLDSGLNKVAHEWLSWAMVAGVVLHVLVNSMAFKRYFQQRRSLAVMAVFALALAGSFASFGKQQSGPPFAAPIAALAHAPLPALAQVAGVSMDELNARLAQAKLPAGQADQSLADLVGGDLKAQIRALNQLLGKRPA